MSNSLFLRASATDLGRMIVSILKEQPRASITAIAAEVGAPRAVVSRRLQELFDSRSVRVSTAMNPTLLGHEVIANVSLRVSGPASEAATWLCQFPDVVFASLVAGEYDLVAELREPDTMALQSRLVELRARPDVLTVDSLIYLHHSWGPVEAAGSKLIDDLDREIIRLLIEDGRLPFQSIAQEVRLSPSAVRARVKRLTDANIIRFGTVESRGSSDRQLAMGVGLRMSSPADEVMSLFASSPNVDFAVEAIGRFDIIATLVADSPESLLELIEELRTRSDVRQVDSWVHLDTVKEDFSRLL